MGKKINNLFFELVARLVFAHGSLHCHVIENTVIT